MFVGMNTETGAKIVIKELDSKSLFSQTLFNNKSGKEQPLKYESFAHLQKEITIDDLWLIDLLDEKWINLQLCERSLMQHLEKIQKRYSV